MGAAFSMSGWGVGRVAVAIAKAFPNCEVVGLDPDPESIRQAREAAAKEGPQDGIQFVARSTRDLDRGHTAPGARTKQDRRGGAPWSSLAVQSSHRARSPHLHRARCVEDAECPQSRSHRSRSYLVCRCQDGRRRRI
jgi:hypothetical protein